MVRAGYGFAHVGALHPGYFALERKRAIFWALALPLAAIGLAFLLPVALFAIVFLYLIAIVRCARMLKHKGFPLADSVYGGALVVISKFANLQGILRFWLKQIRKRPMELIEYK